MWRVGGASDLYCQFIPPKFIKILKRHFTFAKGIILEHKIHETRAHIGWTRVIMQHDCLVVPKRVNQAEPSDARALAVDVIDKCPMHTDLNLAWSVSISPDTSRRDLKDRVRWQFSPIRVPVAG
jgi:hypothetical protein